MHKVKSYIKINDIFFSLNNSNAEDDDNKVLDNLLNMIQVKNS